MSGSLPILICFAAGLLTGWLGLLPAAWHQPDGQLLVLYALLFFTGITVGANRDAWKLIRQARFKILLVPLGTAAGSLGGALLCRLLIPDRPASDLLAVASGLGYYSLSSIIISASAGEMLGVLGLLANLFREILTFLLTPLLARRLGGLAPVAAGGATAMDTSLPLITRYAGPEYAVISVFSGFILTLAVPFLVTAFLRLDF